MVACDCDEGGLYSGGCRGMGWAGRGLPKAGAVCTVGEPISGIPGVPPIPAPLAVGVIPFISCDGGKGMGISEMDGV